MARCSVGGPECVSGRLRRGMCERHYRRSRKYGTPHRIDHLQRYEVDVTGCWVWTGPRFRNGYGHIAKSVAGTTLAHRAFYAVHVGPLEGSTDLDHLCRNRLCVNPTHLEPVTRSTNIFRGYEARYGGHCPNGHDMTKPDAWWIPPNGDARMCRRCKAEREQQGRLRRKGVVRDGCTTRERRDTTPLLDIR